MPARAAIVVRRLDSRARSRSTARPSDSGRVGGAAALPGLLRALDAVGVNAVSAEVKRPTLDDVFLELTGRSLRDAGDIAAESASSQPSPLRPWRSRHDPRQPHRDRPRSSAPPDVARSRSRLIFGVLQPHRLPRRCTARSWSGMPGAGGESPWQWFVPGIIVMVSLFGTSVAGAYLLEELRVGSFERFLVTPLDRSSLLIGRALKEVVPLTLQAILIVALVTPFGFQLHPVGVVVGLLILGIVRDRPGRAVALAGDGRQAPGVPVLARPADAAVPAAATVGHPAAAGLRARLAPGALAAQPADLRRRGGASPVRR